MADRYKSLEKRFWAKVHKTHGCWEWVGAKDSGGYGAVGHNGKKVKAHRVSWMLKYGPIPDRDGKPLCVLHKCDNRKCVNPDHLFLGTYKDNLRDCINKGRFPVATLTEPQIREIFRLRKVITQRDLSRQYNVSLATICRIHQRISWEDITAKELDTTAKREIMIPSWEEQPLSERLNKCRQMLYFHGLIADREDRKIKGKLTKLIEYGRHLTNKN